MLTRIAPIKAYQVTVRELNPEARPESEGDILHREIFNQGPGVQAFAEYRYGGDEGTHLRIRQKTDAGDCLITARVEGDHARLFKVNPEAPTDVVNSDGKKFRVEINPLAESHWGHGQNVPFKPPRATVSAEETGWRVSFFPQEYPCILTCAVTAGKMKDEGLPSFPFPSEPRHTGASFVIPYGSFMAEPGGLVRLGVRGAGLQVRLALPERGKAVTVEPHQFQVAGPADKSLMSDEYVNEKYKEKKSLLSWIL